ncbi:MAG: hypothetical protein O9972_39660 [Burkholderiales bacterium]|nr:hypothetical protein [Burkholderiales bacterium]
MIARTYRPRRMPRRFMIGAPEIVARGVVDIIAIRPAAPLDFDIILSEGATTREIAGLDFGADGDRGCHFYLSPHQMRAYRARNRRKRVAWADLPDATRRAVVAYLEWTP